ncbi:MAG: protein kinase [bacterium]
MIGQEILHYKIVEKLGEGGMGVVYKANDTKLKRDVAIKFLPRQIAATEEERQRFKIEAQVAAALNHSNIATIHAIEEVDDEIFIVMEYIEGQELREIVGATGPVTPTEAIDYAIQIAEGLQAAHKRGIIHRDIKSSNIMITEDYQVKIMDFGLARFSGQTMFTKSGTTLGTVAYMSPEQARGEKVDHRTDIWSLGVVLYEILTGQLPFPGDYEQAVIYSILNEKPKLISNTPAEVPEVWQQIIDKALAKEANERYQSAGGVLDDLRAVQQAKSISTLTVTSRKRLAMWLAPALLILLVGIWFFTQFEFSGRKEMPVLTAKTIAVMPFSVRGSEQFDYLGEGMVNLLSTSLDGAGDLRSVNAHALLGFVGVDHSGAFSNKRAKSVAEHFDAGRYVVGDIVEAGGRLQISASLFDRQQDSQALASESVGGEAEELFELVDRLAARLVAGLLTGATARRTRLAAMTTSSLPAMKAFLEGEQSYRAGLYPKAINAFKEAVAADSTFALAFYRLSMAQERLAWAEESRVSAELAYRHSQPLSDHDRQFLEAVVALRRGQASKAEEMFRIIVRAYPDDAEAWYQLGELMFHGNPLRGGSMSAAREALSQALFYDPSDLGALYHLVRIAAKNRDRAMLDSLTNRFVELSPSGQRTLELRALRAFTVDDTLDANSIVAELRNSPDTFLPLAVWSVATFAHDLHGAVPIARLMTESDRPRDVRARGHFLLAHLELARGRRRAAENELQTASLLGDPGAREAQAWFAALPFLPTSRTEIELAIAQIEEWENANDISSQRPSAFFSAHNGVHASLRTYLLGLLAAKLGNVNSALLYADALEQEQGTMGRVALARQMGRGLRAHIGILQGRQADALAELEQLRIEGWYELTFVSPFYSGALERFALAELLLSHGRLQDALGWYVGLGENTVAELVFFGPSLLRRASIHEQLGQAKEAMELREQFRNLWKDADPGLLAFVEEVK